MKRIALCKLLVINGESINNFKLWGLTHQIHAEIALGYREIDEKRYFELQLSRHLAE
jgi:hypothetical protein